jgi:hypothetical protein
LRNCPKRGRSNTPTVDLAVIRTLKRAEVELEGAFRELRPLCLLRLLFTESRRRGLLGVMR